MIAVIERAYLSGFGEVPFCLVCAALVGFSGAAAVIKLSAQRGEGENGKKGGKDRHESYGCVGEDLYRFVRFVGRIGLGQFPKDARVDPEKGYGNPKGERKVPKRLRS